jgi:hypothetical protein
MPSSGMLRCVAPIRTDVSENLSAYIISVTIIGELGTTLAVTSNRRMLHIVFLVILMMGAPRSYETSVLTSATRCNISEDGILHSHRHENLKSYIMFTSF